MSIIDNLIQNDSNFSKNGLLSDIKEKPDSDIYDKLIKYNSGPNTKSLRDCDTQASLKGILDETLLSNTFFSVGNVQNIQDMIRYYFYKEKGKIISEQSNNELLIIMRSIYLKYSNSGANTSEEIKYEIRELNKIVTEFSLKQIYINYDNYNKYLDDYESLPIPLDLPKIPDRNTNSGDFSLRNDMS
tara:strand:- start:2396 stop:2956 length:561 start_codon:yes stop_codon:yes gene_type:complete